MTGKKIPLLSIDKKGSKTSVHFTAGGDGSLSLLCRDTKKAKDDECKCCSGILCEVVPVPSSPK